MMLRLVIPTLMVGIVRSATGSAQDGSPSREQNSGKLTSAEQWVQDLSDAELPACKHSWSPSRTWGYDYDINPLGKTKKRKRAASSDDSDGAPKPPEKQPRTSIICCRIFCRNSPKSAASKWEERRIANIFRRIKGKVWKKYWPEFRKFKNKGDVDAKTVMNNYIELVKLTFVARMIKYDLYWHEDSKTREKRRQRLLQMHQDEVKAYSDVLAEFKDTIFGKHDPNGVLDFQNDPTWLSTLTDKFKAVVSNDTFTKKALNCMVFLGFLAKWGVFGSLITQENADIFFAFVAVAKGLYTMGENGDACPTKFAASVGFKNPEESGNRRLLTRLMIRKN